MQTESAKWIIEARTHIEISIEKSKGNSERQQMHLDRANSKIKFALNRYLRMLKNGTPAEEIICEIKNTSKELDK